MRVGCARMAAVCVALASLAVPNARAQDGAAMAAAFTSIEEMTLEELLNIRIDVASHAAEDVFQTASSVSVIDRSTIRAFGFSTVAEALEAVAGVSVLRTYLKRNLPTVRGILQEHYANKVLVMINGVPAWNAVTGEGSLDRVSISDVERIEVLKGPASVLYGTNAYSGAINIVLRQEAHTTAEADFRLGTGRRIEGGANYSHVGDDFRLFLSANGGDAGGHNVTFTDELDVTGRVRQYIYGNNFNLAANVGNHSVLVNASRVHEDHFGVLPRFDRGAGDDHTVTGYLANYGYDGKITDWLQLRTGATYDWQHRNFTRRLQNSNGNVEKSNVTGWRGYVYLNSTLTLSDYIALELGGDVDYRVAFRYSNYEPRTQRIISNNGMRKDNDDPRTIVEHSGYAQAKVNHDPIVLVAGVRVTRNDLFNLNIAARATTVYKLSDHSSLKLVAGQSFRAPTLFEQHFDNSVTVLGDPNLKPETSDSVEAAYLARFGDFFMQALGYWARYDNKIYRQTTEFEPGRSIGIYSNAESFTSTGGELELRYRAPTIATAFFNLYYVNGDNGDEIEGSNHYNFKYIPPLTASAGLSKTYHGFFASATTHFWAERNGRHDPLEAQFSVNLMGGYEHEGMRHSVSAKNILNEEVLIPEYVRSTLNDYPSGYGRSVFYRFEGTF